MAGMSRASPSDTLLLMDGATGKGQGNSRFPALVMRWVTAPIIQVGETWGGARETWEVSYLALIPSNSP